MDHAVAADSPRRRALPRDRSFDSTLAWLRDPYRFIARRCRRLHADLFETRLLLRRTICMTGRDAAELFYDEERFVRSDVAPRWLQRTLFGVGGVQGLDGQAHRHRKQLFLSIVSPDRIDTLVATASREWRIQSQTWPSRRRVILYDELGEIFTRAVCRWAGIALPEEDVAKRTGDLVAMFDRAAALGFGHLRSRWARVRAERWAASWIDDLRAGRAQAPAESASQRIAQHRDLSGRLLPLRVAAVELLNVLRPTVAVSVFGVFVALALYDHPDCRRRIERGDPGFLDRFVQEVRRFYPFFPAVMARVRRDFEWRGHPFPAGRRVALDLYGIDHDRRVWRDPEVFLPDRFYEGNADPFSFVPQGGGDARQNHRCPGEPVALALMKLCVLWLARGMRFALPQQDLTLDFARMPALPRSRFAIERVKLLASPRMLLPVQEVQLRNPRAHA